MALLTYDLDGEHGVATVTMDDGKANALSPAMIAELNGAVDRAEADDAVLVLTGRPGRFSGGFDLSVMGGGGREVFDLVESGFELSYRLLSHPRPVVIACSGHAVAMGAFLVLSGDLRLGLTGDARIVANEVAIGMTLPHAAIAVLRQRLTPAAFERAALLAEPFSGEAAVAAGFFDRVVEPEALADEARAAAVALAALDRDAHAATKAKARRPTFQALRAAIDADHADADAFFAG